MTDSNTPVPDAAVLPIVAWLHELTTESYRESSITSFSETDPWVDALKDIGHAVLSRPLTPQAPAQAQINSLRDELSGAYELLHRTEDEKMSLRDEVERLKREAQERALQYLSDNGQWIEEVARLKAALAQQGDDVRDAAPTVQADELDARYGFVTKIAREMALEEAAKVCEDQAASPALAPIESYRARFIADSIRALASTEPSAGKTQGEQGC